MSDQKASKYIKPQLEVCGFSPDTFKQQWSAKPVGPEGPTYEELITFTQCASSPRRGAGPMAGP
jgi:hypothetical protein